MKTTLQFEVWDTLCKSGNHNVLQMAKRLGYSQDSMKNTMRYLVVGKHVIQHKVRGQRHMQYEPIINNPPKMEGIERVKRPRADTPRPEANAIALLPVIRLGA